MASNGGDRIGLVVTVSSSINSFNRFISILLFCFHFFPTHLVPFNVVAVADNEVAKQEKRLDHQARLLVYLATHLRLFSFQLLHDWHIERANYRIIPQTVASLQIHISNYIFISLRDMNW